jgi:hypothetical protein
LRPLIISNSASVAYSITDGDIECTPEIEPSFNYIWNFCGDVPSAALPTECKDVGKKAVILQWANYGAGLQYCNTVGHFDSSINEITYSLIDASDPSKGVSLTYPAGDRCEYANNQPRQGTIDVYCSNTAHTVKEAKEPSTCVYHMSMNSYYGCPTVSCFSTFFSYKEVPIVILFYFTI